MDRLQGLKNVHNFLITVRPPTKCPTILYEIGNDSLSSGHVPEEFKVAHVTPLLKNTSLDKNVLKNHRPVSNLPFVTKVLERAVAKQLQNYLTVNNLHEPQQSAYRKHRSTETALLCVQNDIVQAIDGKKSVILVLLDLSAAFDTIDHTVLLHRLKHDFGITGTALKWLDSYLSHRTQTVKIGDSFSTKHKLLFGVPQGSVLGPVLFSLYSSPVAKIARKYGLCVQLYADDTQLYLSFTPCEWGDALERVEESVKEIKAWMVANKLQLNGDKTQIVLVSAPRANSGVSDLVHVQIDGHPIPFSTSVKNLGVIFDKQLNMEAHVKSLCRSCMFHLRNISNIRRLLSHKIAEQLIHAFVTFRLDYCNSLLSGLPSSTICHLQRVQNIAARILTRTKKYDHITPILQYLHWLPVRERIIFKIMLLTYRGVNGMASTYIERMLIPYKPQQSLRSSESG